MYSTTYDDRTLTCADCGTQFTFSASDQQFYADRQFSEPRRCPTCRAARKAARGGGGYGDSGAYGDGGSYGNGGNGGSYGNSGYGRGPREMFSATCANCGREALVPFRPSGAKPVYCSDCFSTRR